MTMAGANHSAHALLFTRRMLELGLLELGLLELGLLKLGLLELGLMLGRKLGLRELRLERAAHLQPQPPPAHQRSHAVRVA